MNCLQAFLMGNFREEGMTHCSTCPLLLKNIAFKFPVKEIPNFLQLALGFTLVIFKSFGISIGFVEFDFEHVSSEMNPGAVGEKEFMAGLIDQDVISSTALLYIFILRARGC